MEESKICVEVTGQAVAKQDSVHSDTCPLSGLATGRRPPRWPSG